MLVFLLAEICTIILRSSLEDFKVYKGLVLIKTHHSSRWILSLIAPIEQFMRAMFEVAQESLLCKNIKQWPHERERGDWRNCDRKSLQMAGTCLSTWVTEVEKELINRLVPWPRWRAENSSWQRDERLRKWCNGGVRENIPIYEVPLRCWWGWPY